MGSVIAEEPGMGKLVALEGDVDTISTQLRLLPPSQKILVLPSVLENLPRDQDNDAFNARSFVRHVHNAFTDRTEKARSFLGSSTSTQPRLVFTHGGSVSARSTCIARIAESVTDGNISEAQAIFDEIVKDGVAGLMRDEVHEDNSKFETRKDGGDKTQEELEQTVEDPSTTAMKAADSLDRETAGLDTDGHVDDAAETLSGETLEVDDLTPVEEKRIEGEDDRPTSCVLPTTPPNSFEDSKLNRPRKSMIPVREFIFTAPQGEEIKRTVVVLPRSSSLWNRRKTAGSAQIPQLTSTTISAASSSSEHTPCQIRGTDNDDDFDIHSPGTDTFPSTPVVVYGEACLIEMQSAKSDSPPLRKVKSVDGFFPGLFANPQLLSSPKSVRQSVSFYHPNSRPMTSDGGIETPSSHFRAVPRPTFVKAFETTIRRSPTASDCASSSSSLKVLPRVYVDRGTCADEATTETEVKEEEVVAFEPVFPVVEDLIINLTPKGSDEIFDTVISSYKDGSYPVFPNLELKDDSISEIEIECDESSRPATAETDDVDFDKRQTYDPYAYHPDGKAQWPLKNYPKVITNRARSPPTPSRTPLPNEVAEKMIDFSPLDSSNAVSLQNSLRQILSVIFPATDGYSQHLYPVSPEMERLWKPVFKVDESGLLDENSRTVDQIVALGCESGVKQEFFCQVSGQIERLGAKKNGGSRSGKLDIRYFIANIMQTFSTSNSPNPLLNPEILAALIVPQLESFLATNASTRLLILHYTSAHLGVILALQKLIGSEILKVAGILDTLSSDPPSFSRPRTPQKINPLSNEATMARPSSRRLHHLSLKHQLSSSDSPPLPTAKPQLLVSFSKANYLIPNTATDSEITVFLSGIWKSLMERSTFYTPELEPPPPTPTSKTTSTIRPITPRLPTPKTPTTSSFRQTTNSSNSNSHFNGEISYPPSSFRAPRINSEKIAKLTGTSGGVSHKYAHSIASTVRTTASERGRREDREWENFYIAEEDSEDDAYDKMILGREYKSIRPEVRTVKKRNTKKALKWLGLA